MITVKLFALARDTAGRSELQMEDPVGTVGDLLQKLSVRHPALAELIGHGRLLISVNREFAEQDTPVQDGDEVALMPPFSGGTIMHEQYKCADTSKRDSVREAA